MLKATVWNISKVLWLVCAMVANNAYSAEPEQTGKSDLATKTDIVISVQSCPDVSRELRDLTSGPTKQPITNRLLMRLVADCEMQRLLDVKADQKLKATNAK